MYERDQLPRRPAIPITLYAFASVLIAERQVLKDGVYWHTKPGGMVLIISCVVLVVLTIVAFSRSWTIAGTLAVFFAGLVVGVILASGSLAGYASFKDAATSMAVSGWELRVSSEPTLREGTYRCRATMCRDGCPRGDVWLSLPRREDMGTTLNCVGSYIPNEEDEWGVSSRMQGVWGTVRVVRIVRESEPYGLLGAVMRVRSLALSSIDAGSSPERALLAGCVCGWKEGITSRGLDEIFSRCGISHLVAVSGSHMSVFASLLGVLLERLHVRRELRVAALMIVCGLYVVFCGMSSSAVRAYVMTSVAWASGLFGRRSNGLAGVCVAGLVMILLEPSVSGQVGFLLSVSCVGGLCLFSAYGSYVLVALKGRLSPLRLPRRVQKAACSLASGARDSAAASIVAQLSTLPIAACAFGEVSLVGPLTNVLVSIPFLVLVSLGIVAVALSVFPPLQCGLLVVCDACCACVLMVAQALAKLPGTSVSLKGYETFVAWAICGLAVALLFFWPRVRRAWVMGACVVAVCALATYFVRWRYFAPSRVCVLDVGQGDCILVQDGSAAILVDTGPPGAVAEAMRRNNVLHLDAVVLTHLHDDHYGGLPDLVGHVPCDSVYVGKGAQPHVPQVVRDAACDLTRSDVGFLGYGDHLRVGDYDLKVIWPHGEADGTHNEDSLMLDLVYRQGEASLKGLLTGDAEQDEIERVIEAGECEDVDFLKVGHHGSAVSLSHEQALTLDSEVAVASAGENNRYGHPTKECIEALESAGSTFLCTKDVGDVTVYPAREGPRVGCQKKEGSVTYKR